MKIKEIDRTANVAWSPANQYPIYLAAGTAAQQLDATFSTSAALDIYSMNLADPSLDMQLVGTLPSESRFHKLVWGPSESKSSSSAGLLMGGADNGNLFVWNPEKILKKEDPLIYKLDKHVGAVAALDVNPFQLNLLASGASESEIFLWDLNNPTSPMTPGSKSQPPDDVTCLAWNKQVQHILASTYSGRCVVWDLRKNEPIIKVSDSMTRIKCKLVAWHPAVATQMCLASEDDHTPVIQLWDLRFATSPLKVLENHQRGVLSVAWCQEDPDLLLSCGKDNRILCWDPNSHAQTGEVVYELPTSNQWSFDVQWCPRNPAVISSCSFDGHVSIYSLMGGKTTAQAPPSNKISDSFPADPFAAPLPQQTQAETQESVLMLKKPPKWLRKPCGATFGFGGKLVTVDNTKPQNPQQPAPQAVHISQVVTETDLVARSNQLESALVNGQFTEFCSLKIANSQNEMEESIWNFLKVNFENDPRLRYLQLLGYDQTDLSKKVMSLTGSDGKPTSLEDSKPGVDASELAQKMSLLNTGEHLLKAPYASSGQASPYIGGAETPGSEGLGAPDGTAAFDQIAIQDQDTSRDESPLTIAVDDDCDGLVTQALLTANFEAAVDVCIHNNRMAEAVILAIAGGPELLARTQKMFFRKHEGNLNRLISSVVTKDFEQVIRTCELESWKEALALALTYAKGDDFANLCDILGTRLESEKSGSLAPNACLCYVCAGNVEKLVDCWNRFHGVNGAPDALQDLVEKVMILKKAVELARGQSIEVSSGPLANKLSQYAELLAAQGNLQTALNYLGNSNEYTLAILRDRLYNALGVSNQGHPFQVIDIQPEGVKPQPQQPQQPQQPNQRQRSNSGFYQAQAGSFQTTTTPTSNYQTQQAPQQYMSGYNQQTMPTYSQQQNIVAASTASAINKGPLSQKYPSYPQATSSYESYSQSGFGASYNNPTYNPQSYPASQASAVPTQTQIFDPTAAAAAQQTPGVSSGRRSSKAYDDTEAIAGVLGSMSPRRGSLLGYENYNMTKELNKGAPFVPSSQPSSLAGAAAATNVPSYQDVRPQAAWNDPPALRGKKEPKQYQPQAPITQPIFGVPAPQDQGPPGGPSYSGAPTSLYNPQQYQPQPVSQAPVAPPAPPKPVEKPPIPAEHKVLQDILQALVNQCIGSAANPQLKRKLEDVIRKLETLYDKLRDQTLSPSVLQGLHQIVQAIQQYDYSTGFAYHTQMISQGNFSEISSFMPGIKVLLQIASQQQIYLQQ